MPLREFAGLSQACPAWDSKTDFQSARMGSKYLSILPFGQKSCRPTPSQKTPREPPKKLDRKNQI
jgi:hypothetical protein